MGIKCEDAGRIRRFFGLCEKDGEENGGKKDGGMSIRKALHDVTRANTAEELEASAAARLARIKAGKR